MNQTADPEAMRRAAAVVADRAAQLSTIAARTQSLVGGMIYAGPAAIEFRAVMAERISELSTMAGQLQSLSDDLTREALTVQATMGPPGVFY